MGLPNLEGRRPSFINFWKVIDDKSMVRPGSYSVVGCHQIWETEIPLDSYSVTIVKPCDFDVHQSIKLHSKTNCFCNISQGLSNSTKWLLLQRNLLGKFLLSQIKLLNWKFNFKIIKVIIGSPLIWNRNGIYR